MRKNLVRFALELQMMKDFAEDLRTGTLLHWCNERGPLAESQPRTIHVGATLAAYKSPILMKLDPYGSPHWSRDMPKKFLVLAMVVVCATMVLPRTAHAGDDNDGGAVFSFGFGAPPLYAPAPPPSYYALPPPAYYGPPPGYYGAPPGYYVPPPGYGYYGDNDDGDDD